MRYNALSTDLDDEEDDITSQCIDESEDEDSKVEIIVLDPAQKRFKVTVSPSWSVLKLKEVGVQKTCKVAVASQRLIFNGKMLDDSKKLRDVGIDRDNIIIHLFPKPRVVITSSSAVTEEPSSDPHVEGGAHVPSIILDEEEQERRGQILVLGSAEISEAQNNVKLLSLALLVVCGMRLFALSSIAMGVAEDPSYNNEDSTSSRSRNHTGDDFYDNTNYQPHIRQWQNSDYFDLMVSAIGFYVATLGMKATTENTLRLATAYMIGTVIAGIGWNLWNIFSYVKFVKEQSAPKDDDEVIPLSRDDYVTVAFFTVMLPILVWGLCFARAWEFRRLIEEAEAEAAERIRSQLTISDGSNDESDEADASRQIVV